MTAECQCGECLDDPSQDEFDVPDLKVEERDRIWTMPVWIHVGLGWTVFLMIVVSGVAYHLLVPMDNSRHERPTLIKTPDRTGRK